MTWKFVPRGSTANISGLDSSTNLFFPDTIDFRNESDTDFDEFEYLIPIVIKIDDENVEASRLIGRLVNEGFLQISSWYLTESIANGQVEVKYPRAGSTYVAYASTRFFGFLSEVFGITDFDGLKDLDLRPLIDAVKVIELRSPIPVRKAVRPGAKNDSTNQPLTNPSAGNHNNSGEKSGTAVENSTEQRSEIRKVITAVIDDGIAIANSRFNNSSGTRIEYFWPQKLSDGPVDIENVDDWTKVETDNLRAECTINGIFDEDLFYHKAKLLPEAGALQENQLTRRTSHGTHVLDMAAGFALEQNVTNRPIIAVQLPHQQVRDTSGREGDRDHYVLQALEYILNRADALSQHESHPLPLVINFSFGTYSGPHDGSTLLEQRIDEIIKDRDNTIVVLPAGNSRQTRTHARLSKNHFSNSTGTVELNWRVQPDDLTDSYLHIWLPADGTNKPPTANRVKVSVVAPNGNDSPELNEYADPESVDEDEQANLNPYIDYFVNDGSKQVCRLSNGFKADKTNRSYYSIVTKPTANNENYSNGEIPTPAPSGLWRVVIRDVDLPENAIVECWIERDNTALGYRPRGRQSYFDDPQYGRFDAKSKPVLHDNKESTTRRNGTLSSLATGKNPIVVGAMYHKEQTVTDYSSCGPASIPFSSSKPSREGPDLVTISDASRVHVGIPGAGTRSGSVVYLNGTSVAAPLVARYIADLSTNGQLPDRDQIRTIVDAAETNDELPEECYGKGRLILPHPHNPKDRIERDNFALEESPAEIPV